MKKRGAKVRIGYPSRLKGNRTGPVAGSQDEIVYNDGRRSAGAGMKRRQLHDFVNTQTEQQQ